MNVNDFQRRKQQGIKISMLTCYDYWTARILNKTDVDCLLVGDSLAMVVHGYESTVHATVEMMAMHISAVKRGAPDKFIVGDMPFLSCSKGLEAAMDAVQALMQAGASAVKIEGAEHQTEIIKHIVEAGVPVMGHIGLTPQSIHALGGHRVQGKNEEKARELCKSAAKLAEAGCFSLVMECVPLKLAGKISQSIPIPTIGIGAGPDVDGQVLVLQDLIGADGDFKPRFLRHYADSDGLLQEAVNHFHRDVTELAFPALEESYQ
ncbi:MAG: 3-methyl-2-oxobutanoate hydroxymethyltransferase [Gammaproteobacteria bacterium]|nr:3-methyl-2-oxobutanoate hydroxymethyltransferase [Gammaproteobacteria bacterium]